jgi:hypothetical protein
MSVCLVPAITNATETFAGMQSYFCTYISVVHDQTISRPKSRAN